MGMQKFSFVLRVVYNLNAWGRVNDMENGNDQKQSLFAPELETLEMLLLFRVLCEVNLQWYFSGDAIASG